MPVIWSEFNKYFDSMGLDGVESCPEDLTLSLEERNGVSYFARTHFQHIEDQSYFLFLALEELRGRVEVEVSDEEPCPHLADYQKRVSGLMIYLHNEKVKTGVKDSVLSRLLLQVQWVPSFADEKQKIYLYCQDFLNFIAKQEERFDTSGECSLIDETSGQKELSDLKEFSNYLANHKDQRIGPKKAGELLGRVKRVQVSGAKGVKPEAKPEEKPLFAFRPPSPKRSPSYERLLREVMDA